MRYERMGLDLADYQGANEYLINRRFKKGKEDLSDLIQMVDLHHIELNGVYGNGESLANRAIAAYCAEISSEDPDEIESLEMDWIDIYPVILMLALLLDDEDAVQKLLSWLTPDIPYDDGAFNASKAYCHFYQYLSLWCQDKRDQEAALDLRKKIESSRRKVPKVLLSGLDAIDASDAEKLKVVLSECRANHLKLMQKEPVHECIIPGATILFHLARRKGIDLELDQEVMDWIGTKESIAWPENAGAAT